MSVSNGVFTITGDANGTTGGMAWKQGRSQYGRWEARVKSPVADPSYNAVMLLWPNAENWPVGGEVDFMEIGDETRQEVDFFLHYGEENRQLHDQVAIDATQWHNWAVEWAPGKITGYVDGEPWFSTTQASALPPGPMHLTLQLDWFPKGGGVQQSTMDVDWVRYYPIDGSGPPPRSRTAWAAARATASRSLRTRVRATGGTVRTRQDTDGGTTGRRRHRRRRVRQRHRPDTDTDTDGGHRLGRATARPRRSPSRTRRPTTRPPGDAAPATDDDPDRTDHGGEPTATDGSGDRRHGVHRSDGSGSTTAAG